MLCRLVYAPVVVGCVPCLCLCLCSVHHFLASIEISVALSGCCQRLRFVSFVALSILWLWQNMRFVCDCACACALSLFRASFPCVDGAFLAFPVLFVCVTLAVVRWRWMRCLLPTALSGCSQRLWSVLFVALSMLWLWWDVWLVCVCVSIRESVVGCHSRWLWLWLWLWLWRCIFGCHSMKLWLWLWHWRCVYSTE